MLVISCSPAKLFLLASSAPNFHFIIFGPPKEKLETIQCPIEMVDIDHQLTFLDY